MKLPPSARKIAPFPISKNLARKVLCVPAMSSLENIYKIMAESAAGAGALHETAQKFDSARHISPGVAHELNNIIAIIQGYADRLRSSTGIIPRSNRNSSSSPKPPNARPSSSMMPCRPLPARPSGPVRPRRNSPPRNSGFFPA